MAETLEAVAFITDLLGSPVSEHRDGTEHIWAWTTEGTQVPVVHLIGNPGSMPMIIIDCFELNGEPLNGILQFAIIGWCVRYRVLCLIDEGDARYMIMRRKVSKYPQTGGSGCH